MSTTTEVTVIGPNLPAAAGATFHVHRAGCADIARSPLYRRIEPPWSMTAGSEQEVITDVYSDIIAENEGDLADWHAYVSEFRFFPCVALPFEEVAS